MEKSFRENYNEALKRMENITDRQKAILQAALDLFAEQGFEATSTSQIAKKANVSLGSVYHTFRNKNELLMAVMTPMFKNVFQSSADQFIDQTLGKKYDNFSDFIYSLVKDRIRFIDDNFKIIKIMAGELLTDHHFTQQIIDIFSKQLFQSAMPTIEQFKQQGEIIDWPNKDILQVIFGPFSVHFGKLVLGIADLTEAGQKREIEVASQSIIKALAK